MRNFWLFRFLGSTVGKKIVVGITGLVLLGFLAGHVTGNMLFMAGKDKINAYAHTLHASAVFLWGFRIVMLACVLLHVLFTVQLWLRNQSARPVGYMRKEALTSSWASRTMIISGPIIAIFVVYHLMHLTTGTAHPDFQPENVHANMAVGLKVVPVAIFYIVAVLLLALHLWHGIWSMFQTVGLINPKYDPFLRKVAWVGTILIVGGFVSIPFVIVTGILP